MAKYKFTNLWELIDQIKALGYNPESKEKKDQVLVDISGTPLESLFGAGDVNYGDPPQKFVVFGFGGDRMTPWGPLPQRIILVRKDVVKQLEVDKPSTPTPAASVKKSSLFPPGWKPAPGFTDPRKDWR